MQRLFHWLGPDFGHTVFHDDGTLTDPADFAAAAYYSDANSAARRSLLTGAIPYRDVQYAEDQLFGRDVLRAGLRKAYAPHGSVIHSNDLDVRGTYRRAIDDVIGLRRLGTVVPELGLGRALVRGIAESLRHGLRIVRDREYPPTRRVFWFLRNPAYDIAQWLGHRRGTRQPIQLEQHAVREAR
jgi:rhamnosyltransferase